MQSEETHWQTATAYQQHGLSFTAHKFFEVTDLLLANPNLNSTHLFRADIVYDSAGVLQTPEEKVSALDGQKNPVAAKAINGGTLSELPEGCDRNVSRDDGYHSPPPLDLQSTPWAGFHRRRTVIRTLIPRKPQLDKPLNQTCFVYSYCKDSTHSKPEQHLVVYLPSVDEENVPWYHPSLRGFAYHYERSQTGTSLSVHFLPFAPSSDPLPTRLDRTLLSLLRTFIRLAKDDIQKALLPSDNSQASSPSARSLAAADLKDTIVAQHLVQDTYTRLKQTYAADLIERWVEKTEPSKHVFEDLSIASFLIELWKQMYQGGQFPGFVDIACGNGVLVYVLRKEGFTGFGLDARRRKTWDILGVDEHLQERICIPKPFLDALALDVHTVLPGTDVHDGIFSAGTFILSNHADELTPWTPILAALAPADRPLPYLVIPCCSHALSGARHRYSPRDYRRAFAKPDDKEQQPANGDLKALRAAKTKSINHQDDKSMYACLTRKVVAVAEELGHDVELTLMRIPSTRNIGIVGNRNGGAKQLRRLEKLSVNADSTSGSTKSNMGPLLERECATSGGLEKAARAWIDRAQKLQTGKGRGKVNLGRPDHD